VKGPKNAYSKTKQDIVFAALQVQISWYEENCKNPQQALYNPQGATTVLFKRSFNSKTTTNNNHLSTIQQKYTVENSYLRIKLDQIPFKGW
jgi:hypothetical protein